jgi:hypothetical protein
MAKPISMQPLARVLTSDATIASWHARMRAESLLTAAVRRHLPRAFADRVRVADAADTTLTLAVGAGAVAAVLRQRTPDILQGLAREGCHFTEIRVRVQVRTDAPTPKKQIGNQCNRIDTTPLEQLAGTLAEGPLKAAVQRLARRIG